MHIQHIQIIVGKVLQQQSQVCEKHIPFDCKILTIPK